MELMGLTPKKLTASSKSMIPGLQWLTVALLSKIQNVIPCILALLFHKVSYMERLDEKEMQSDKLMCIEEILQIFRTFVVNSNIVR